MASRRITTRPSARPRPAASDAVTRGGFFPRLCLPEYSRSAAYSGERVMEDGEFRLNVNGGEHSVQCEPGTPLLDVLRHDLGLAGPKFGCGLGLCGACFVLIGGRARASCDLPVSAVGGPVTTVEGLPGGDRLHPVQQAFIEEQAAQCGYCTSGMVIAAAGLLHDRPAPTEQEAREALDG